MTTEVLPGHPDAAEGPSFLSRFESLPVKYNKPFKELSIGLPKGTSEELAGTLADLVSREIELAGFISETTLVPSRKKMSEIEINSSGIHIRGVKGAAKDLAAQFLKRLVEQCAFLGITDEDQFESLTECTSLPSALGMGRLDFIGNNSTLDDKELYNCVVDALRVGIPQIAEQPRVAIKAAQIAMDQAQHAFLFQLIPIVAKVDPENGLAVLGAFCRKYPHEAARISELLTKKEAKHLHTNIASFRIRKALGDRNYLEAGQALAEARKRGLAPSFKLTETDLALVQECGFDPDRLGGATPCDLLMLVLCSPRIRLLQTAWKLYTADLRVSGRAATSSTQAIFQSYSKDLLPREALTKRFVKRTPREWGFRYLKLAEHAAQTKDAERLWRYVKFLEVLCIVERRLLNTELSALLELITAFPDQPKLQNSVRRIRRLLLAESERLVMLREVAKENRANRFASMLLGTTDEGHGISFDATDPDDFTVYDSFEHALKAIELAEARIYDSDLIGAEAIAQAQEIMSYVILRAQIDTRDRSPRSKQLVSEMRRAFGEMVERVAKNPYRHIPQRALAKLLQHVNSDELSVQPDM